MLFLQKSGKEKKGKDKVVYKVNSKDSPVEIEGNSVLINNLF